MNRIRIASLALAALVIAVGATCLIVRFSGRVDNAGPAVGDLPSEGHGVRGNGEPSVAVGHDDPRDAAVGSPEMHRLKGVYPHQPPVILHTTAHAFSAFADGSRVVCANYEFAELWDLTTGEKVLSLPHPDIVLGCAISPDEKSLLTITAGRASPVRLWSLVSGEIVREYPSPFEDNCSASETESRELSGWNLWDNPRTWRFPQRGFLPKTGFGCTAVAFSPNGRTLVIGSEDGIVTLRSIETGEETARLSTGLGRVYSLVYSPDETRLLVAASLLFAASQCVIQLWDIPGGVLVAQFREVPGDGWPQDFRTPLAFEPDGKRFAFYCPKSQAIRICEAQTGTELQRLPENSRDNGLLVTSHSGCLAFLPDDAGFLSNTSYVLKVWDLGMRSVSRRHLVKSAVFPLSSRAPVEFVRFLPRIDSVMAVEVQNVSDTGHEDWTIISIVPLSAFQQVYRR